MSHNYPSETRQNRITGEWVACAPTRTNRPHQTNAETSPPDPPQNTPIEGCPFCPGHEDQLPSILWELEADDGRPWHTRAVPNKFSAFTPTSTVEGDPPELYRVRPSRGRQEVIIDTPDHHQRLDQMPEPQVEAVVQTYLARYRALRDADLFPFVFRNHGARAGASIPHPHSQIIGTQFPPPRIKREEAAARSRYEDMGHCPYCEMIETELNEEDRMVWTNDEFVAFVPFAAHVPFELWVLPRTHEPEFGRLSVESRSALSETLIAILQRLHSHLPDLEYNFFVRTALRSESEAPHLHWSLRLQPCTTVEAGFEISTGIRINPSIPERDAAVLRGEA